MVTLIWVGSWYVQDIMHFRSVLGLAYLYVFLFNPMHYQILCMPLTNRLKVVDSYRYRNPIRDNVRVLEEKKTKYMVICEHIRIYARMYAYMHGYMHICAHRRTGSLDVAVLFAGLRLSI